MIKTLRSAAAIATASLVAVIGWHLYDSSDDGTAPAAEAGIATVERVVDGDTLVVSIDGHDERVRLIGIDTPESVAQDRPVECYGAEASQRLVELVPAGTAVRLERDIEPRDQYDRLLAYVYRADDELFTNLELVAEGFAEAKEFRPNTARSAELAAAERDARAAGLGLWGVCGGPGVPIGPPPTPGGPGVRR